MATAVQPVALAVLPWTWFAVRDQLGVVGDVLAILLTPVVTLAVVACAVAAVRGRRRRALPAVSALVFGIAAVIGPWPPADAGQWAPLLLRIDHVLVGPGWYGDAARQFELPRSDHRGVTAVIGPCAAAASGT